MYILFLFSNFRLVQFLSLKFPNSLFVKNGNFYGRIFLILKFSIDDCPDIWKPFEPMFIKRKKSEYRNQFSFRTVTQRVGLCDAADG